MARSAISPDIGARSLVNKPQNVLDPAVVRGELNFGELSLASFGLCDAALSQKRRVSKMRFDTLQEWCRRSGH